MHLSAGISFSKTARFLEVLACLYRELEIVLCYVVHVDFSYSFCTCFDSIPTITNLNYLFTFSHTSSFPFRENWLIFKSQNTMLHMSAQHLNFYILKIHPIFCVAPAICVRVSLFRWKCVFSWLWKLSTPQYLWKSVQQQQFKTT